MPKASKTLSLEEQANKLKIAKNMFAQKTDFVGEKVEFGLIGQIVYWNDEKNIGYIRTRDMKDGEDSYFCRGSDFCNQCGKKGIVTFDVWENYQTGKLKAVNVKAHQLATTVIATDEIGTMGRWFGLAKKGIIEGSDGKEYKCSEDDFEQGSFPRGARVCFDIAKDNWTFRNTAVNIRSAKIVRHIHLAGVEGRVVKLGRSFGFVSTASCDKDIYFNGTELIRVHMQHIQYRHRIICDVIMEEDGSLTAENINMHRDIVQKIEPAAQDIVKKDIVRKAPAVDDTVKKVPAVDDDCASTSTKAATDLPASEPVNPEVRKFTKKLREIEVLERQPVLDPLQQAKVAMKHEYQKHLERLTA